MCGLTVERNVDFVTDLAKSEGYTCILIALNRFFKACKLIPLWGLPTALETAEALFHSLFRTFSIPEDDDEADKWGHLPSPTPCTVSYPSIIPCLTPQACLSLCHRTRRARSTSSSWNHWGAPNLQGSRDLGLSVTGWSPGVSDWLGGIRAGGKILGGPEQCAGHLSPGRVSPEPPWPSRTQRPTPSP